MPFETLADDERQCEICQTTLFLSAVACKCNDKKMTCLRHFKHLCKCDSTKKILLYRYQESELASTVKDIKRSLEEYMVWFKNIQEIVFLEKSEKPGEKTIIVYGIFLLTLLSKSSRSWSNWTKKDGNGSTHRILPIWLLRRQSKKEKPQSTSATNS